MDLFTGWKQTQQTLRTNLWLPKGKGGGGRINQEFGINIYTLLYIKSTRTYCITQGTLLKNM